jgi:glyoxylase-like metal-dependent hydrolase (beta-lactamase superfamily II)
METYPIRSGGAVHRFDTGTFNWYVIEEAGRLTLVDAGFPGHYPIFKAGIGALGRSLRDVEAIVLTHAHADHMGFAERLRRETGAPVFVHRDDARKAGRALQLPWLGLLSNAWHPYMARILTHAAINGVFTMPGIGKVEAVEDNEVLDIPGRPRVIHVPGHTPGEIALHVAGAGALIAGDALVTRNLITGRLGGPEVVVPILSYDFAQSLRSIEKLAAIGHATVLSGHGLAWTGDVADAVRLAQDAGRLLRGGRQRFIMAPAPEDAR